MQRFFLCLLAALCFSVAAVAKSDSFIIPPPLKEGSRIAVVSPASAVKDAVIDSAVVRLQERGFVPVVFPLACGKDYGSYAASDQKRAAELMEAFADPEIDAILCSRGGYGTVRLLPLLNADVVRSNPKWLIGYSDISDLHAFMYHAGVASIHGPMAGHLASEPDSLLSTQLLFKVLTDSLPIVYDTPPHDYNKNGVAKGRVVGGNLLTINGLAETPYDVLNIGEDDDVILFFEDVSEKIYAIERVLMRLHYSGALSRVKGLIIGRFTEYSPSEDFESMEDMIYYWLDYWGYYNESNPMPIAFAYPTGHVSDNFPMICGAEAELSVTPYGVSLSFNGN